MSKSSWLKVSTLLPLQNQQLHLFKIDLSTFFAKMPIGHIPFLSADEYCRMMKFRFLKDKIRFGIGRYSLKLLLSTFEDSIPSFIVFEISKFGKPHLKDNPSKLQFNLSHSGKYLLIGIAKEYQIGVDTEVYNNTINHSTLANSVFSKSEQEALNSLENNKQMYGFYNCWSLKESFIKAIGLGLQIPLDLFSVKLDGSYAENALISTEWDPTLMDMLVSKNIFIDTDYSAAYTCHHSINEVFYFDLTPYLLSKLNNQEKPHL